MKEIIKLDINGLQYTIWKEEYERVSKDNFQTIAEYDKINKREKEFLFYDL